MIFNGVVLRDEPTPSTTECQHGWAAKKWKGKWGNWRVWTFAAIHPLKLSIAGKKKTPERGKKAK